MGFAVDRHYQGPSLILKAEMGVLLVVGIQITASSRPFAIPIGTATLAWSQVVLLANRAKDTLINLDKCTFHAATRLHREGNMFTSLAELNKKHKIMEHSSKNSLLSQEYIA
jgi:hypothetical protein